MQQVLARPWFHVPLPPHLDLLKTSTDAITAYFSALPLLAKKNHMPTSPTNIPSKSELRKLRKKRNEIESLKKRAASGEALSKTDIDVLKREYRLGN